MAGCDTVERIGYLLALRRLEETDFIDIESALLRHLEPEERLTSNARSGCSNPTSHTNYCLYIIIACHYMNNAMIEVKLLSQSLQMQIDSGADKCCQFGNVEKFGITQIKNVFWWVRG